MTKGETLLQTNGFIIIKFCSVFKEPEIPEIEEEDDEEKAANGNGSEGEGSTMERVPTADGGASNAGDGGALQEGAVGGGQAAEASAVNPETGEETMMVPAEGGEAEKPETPKLPTTVSRTQGGI